MTNDCKTCPVSTGTHKPAEAVHQIDEPSAQTPEDAQIQALMRKHRIWIEHSTLFENDEPERELRAVQAEEHQFNAFVQDLIAATQLAAAPQAVQPVAPQLKANCYSDDNGDYWRDCPDDCDFVEGLKVGDTYELQASIRAWSETFRVTKAPDETSDDYEVELVSSDAPAHPAEGVPAQAVQPSDALIEAVDAWFADNTGLGGCSDKDVAELAAIFATQPAAQGLEADMFWDSEDGERCGHDIESIIEDYSDGAILKIDCAKSLPSITIRVIQNAEGADYEIVDAALAAQAKQGGA